MAKEKRSAADLDAELAALEAELAALEGRSKKPKAKSAAPAPAPDATERPAKQEKKRGFALPKLGKKEERAPVAAAPTPAPGATAPPPTSPAPGRHAPPAPPASPAPRERYDASMWRQEEDAWVRVVPETPVPVIRRILDENGDVVREEPADMRAVEDVSSVKAERGLGRLLRRK